MSRSVRHIDFPDNAQGVKQWADLWEKPTANEVLRAQKAYRSRLNTDREIEGVFDMETVLLKEWYVTDEEGSPLSMDKVGMGKAPGEIVTNLLFLECIDILKTALPNL